MMPNLGRWQATARPVGLSLCRTLLQGTRSHVAPTRASHPFAVSRDATLRQSDVPQQDVLLSGRMRSRNHSAVGLLGSMFGGGAAEAATAMPSVSPEAMHANVLAVQLLSPDRARC
jgi:hypothetical protein